MFILGAIPLEKLCNLMNWSVTGNPLPINPSIELQSFSKGTTYFILNFAYSVRRHLFYLSKIRFQNCILV